MSNRLWKTLLFTVCAGGAFVFPSVKIAAWQHPTPPLPQPRQSPNAPTNQNAPRGLERLPTADDPSKPQLNPENEQEIRQSVQRLYALAAELKEEVEHTDSSKVFNVSILKRAQDIEKLAKQIKERAKR